MGLGESSAINKGLKGKVPLSQHCGEERHLRILTTASKKGQVRLPRSRNEVGSGAGSPRDHKLKNIVVPSEARVCNYRYLVLQQ